MRNYVIAAIACAITAALALRFFGQNKSRLLRVGLPVSQANFNPDPARIFVSTEYIFLENIYSTLIEIGEEGDILPSLASDFRWQGNDLHLTMRKGISTIGGHQITADDAAFSLKRLIILGQNTHGNFQAILCPGAKLKTIADSCPGIQVQGGELILHAGARKEFLIQMLAAIDFAVIPQSAVDPQTLQIVDMRETSGPYHFENKISDARPRLRVNSGHFHATPSIPQEFEFVPFKPTVSDAALMMLKNGEVDHVMTANGTRVDSLLDFAGSHRHEFNAHATRKIRATHLSFTLRGQKELSADQRLAIGKSVQDAFSEIYSKSTGFEKAIGFFPALASGALDTDQAKQLASRH